VSVRPIPEATVARLPVYLRVLVDMAERGVATVSSEELATASGVNSAKVRKDLSRLGSFGTRGVGYDVPYLIHQVRRELGLTQEWPTIIVGVGNLGQALARYRGFAERGFRIVALLDIDPAKIGTEIDGPRIRPLADLPDIVSEHRTAIGIIATPASAAQEVADAMVTAGIRAILNFAPTTITVPPEVSVRKVDLAIELQILAYHEQRKAALEEVEAERARGSALGA
jgi:redox-sensing transcriptional repressor